MKYDNIITTSGDTLSFQDKFWVNDKLYGTVTEAIALFAPLCELAKKPGVRSSDSWLMVCLYNSPHKPG